MGKVKDLLKEVIDPISGYSIFEIGMVRKVVTKGKDLVVSVNLPKYSLAAKDYIVCEIKSKLIALPYINNVIIEVSTRVLKHPFI